MMTQEDRWLVVILVIVLRRVPRRPNCENWRARCCRHDHPAQPELCGEPELTGIMERWIRMLKGECLYLHDFATLEQARQVIAELIERYNREWLIERHGYRPPADVRASLTRLAA